MLGAMHTEKMALEMFENWLEGSSWTAALTNSGVASGSVAYSFLGVSHLAFSSHVVFPSRYCTGPLLYALLRHLQLMITLTICMTGLYEQNLFHDNFCTGMKH